MTDKYILLVEDNPDDVTLTELALERARIPNKLVVVWDGEEALDFLFSQGKYVNRDHGQNPAAILLDLQLPYISGLEVLKQIRTDERTKLIPVVILSSSISEKDIQDSYALGATKYFRKPMDFDQFTELICQVKSAWLDEDEDSTIQEGVQ